MHNIPIDWADVNWVYVGLLAIFVFFASLIGDLLTFGRRGYGALLSALLFGAAFVFWTYYPHHLPLPTSLTASKPPLAAPAPPSLPPPPAPVRPSNPVTDITPPIINPR